MSHGQARLFYGAPPRLPSVSEMPKHEPTRELLVAHATQLLEEVGLAGFTAREVARRVGVSPAAPFRHFPGRDALLAEVAASGHRALRQLLVAVVPQLEATRNDLVVSRAMEYVAFARERPGIFELMFRSDMVHGDCLAAFVLLLDGAVEEPLHEATPQEISVLAGIHGLAVLASQGVLGPVSREHLRRILERNLADR